MVLLILLVLLMGCGLIPGPVRGQGRVRAEGLSLTVRPIGTGKGEERDRAPLRVATYPCQRCHA